ncbi:hypothetical protein [Natrinema marinum]|uniref:hypothetical protein n=1 Tax=Natrinema marinum TaxID=2961598 RepID=UPI0020C8600B|nr:hypothetical protein [Natrinema marinum]
MATTSSTTVDVSDGQQNEIILEQSGSYYDYLGKDGEGYHHHVDEATNTVYVTPDRAERFLPDDAGLYWFRVRGELDHIEELERDEDRDKWVAYVDSVRGWTDRPVCLDVTDIFAAMHEGDRR